MSGRTTVEAWAAAPANAARVALAHTRHWAARKDHAAVVSLLLELGATRDLANERGQTPMGYAKFLGMHAVIAILEPDEGARKQAVMRAQRAAGDAAAKAEQEQRREQELQARKAAAKSRLDSKVKVKATPQRSGSAGGRGKGKVEGKTAPTRTGAADEALHGDTAEATPTQPKRTKSVTSVPDVAVGGSGGGREEREAMAPVAETMQSKGRREAEMLLKEAPEPLATVLPLTTADTAQAEASLQKVAKKEPEKELGGLSRGPEKAVEKAASREEISATHNAALRMEKDRGEKLLKEKDAELDELRALLRSKPTSAPASAPAPPALAPAPADQALAYASKASWPPGWVE